MTSEQLAEWIAYERIAGLPSHRSDFLLAQLCAVLANIHRNPDREPYLPQDFLPQIGEPADEPGNAEEGSAELIDLDTVSRQLEAMLGKDKG